MKIARYIIRFILALIYLYAGIEKLFLHYDISTMKSEMPMADLKFFEFYDLLMGTGYMYFVGIAELLIGILLIFRRTYLLGAVMLVPLTLGILMTHVFISRVGSFVAFDGVFFSMNLFLIFSHFNELKTLFLKPQKSIV